MARVLYSESYNRRAARFLERHPELVAQYTKTLRLLEADPGHPSLRLHRLSGKLAGLHSVSINLSYRITLEFLVEGDTIIPVDVGSHDEAYG